MRPVDPAGELDPGSGNEVQAWWKQLERRDWWLWWLALCLILLLTLGLVSFSAPRLLGNHSPFSELQLSQLTTGLLGLVLIFSLYTSYQLLIIKRLRKGYLEQHQRAEKFRRLALFDSLTGAYNRRFAEERLAQESQRCERKGYALTVAVLDLNGFKQVNDRYGHLAGDAALKEFVQRLQRASRGSDLVARMGGDEFLLLLPECKPGELEIVLGRLRALDFEFRGDRIPLSFSVGSANYQRGQSAEDLLHAADLALYEGRRAGTHPLVHVS